MASKNDFVSDRRLYLDKDGKVVEADDPARASLLVAKGASLPEDVARKYGLIIEAVPVAKEEVIELSAHTVPQLKEIAKDEEVDLSGVRLKDDIVEAIEEHREGEEESPKRGKKK